MNVYDFDGTIYDGDSTKDFWRFCLKRHPKSALAIVSVLFGLLLYLFGIISKTKFKQRFYSFLRHIPDVDGELSDFWQQHETKIQKWYFAQKKDDDLIISASPVFLLKPICEKLGVRLIASEVDKHSGECYGENCHGDEKVKRFYAEFPGISVNEFYSDSQSDDPFVQIASAAYWVDGESIVTWDEKKIGIIRKVKDVFLTPQFFLFVFQGAVCTAVCIVISLLFSRYVNPTLAYIGGYAVAILLGYILNSYLVFKMPLAFSRLGKFLISYIPNFLILFGIVALSLNVLALPSIVAYTLAPAIGVPLTFLILKFFAFRKNKAKDNMK